MHKREQLWYLSVHILAVSIYVSIKQSKNMYAITELHVYRGVHWDFPLEFE